jgi:hypothetical protein
MGPCTNAEPLSLSADMAFLNPLGGLPGTERSTDFFDIALNLAHLLSKPINFAFWGQCCYLGDIFSVLGVHTDWTRKLTDAFGSDTDWLERTNMSILTLDRSAPLWTEIRSW